MVRDWDVVRELLGKIEDESLKDFIEKLHKDALFGKNDEKFESCVARHLKLLSESGYIKGIQHGCTLPGKVSYVMIEPELTMAGYDLLEVLRSKTVWKSVKEQIKASGVAMTLEAIKVFASQEIKRLSE